MKRIFSLILCTLMVLAIVPVSVFMVSAVTETVENRVLAAGESFTKEIDLTVVDKTQPLVLTFDVTAANATSTAYGHDAVLKINDKRTVRVTSGAAFHIFDESTNSAAEGSSQWGSANAKKNVVATFDFTAGTIRFVYHNRDITINTIDLTGDTLTIKFGDTYSGKITLENISIQYTQLVSEPEQPGDDVIPTDLFSTGAKDYAGWTNGTFDTYTVNANGTDGDITVTFSFVRANWQGKAKVLTINGKTVLFGNGSSGNGAYSLADDATVYGNWPTDCVITVVIDPLTGDATVSDNASHSTTTNVGVIGETFNVVVGQANTNSWSLKGLTVTQEIGVKADTTTREEHRYYKNDFTTISGDIINQSGAVSSTVVDGALKVEPTETNQWNVGGADYPANSVMSFKAMVPELLEEDNDVLLLCDRATRNYFIRVTAGEGKNVVVMNTGNAQPDVVEVEAGEWFEVTIIMTESGSTVFVNNQFMGTTSVTFAGRTMDWGVFHFNYADTDNTVAYYVDDIEINTTADDAFVKVTGYQKTNVDGDKYNVRFIASIADIYGAQENIGFEVSAPAFDKTWNETTTTVYNSITANYGTESVTAEELGGKYITAYAITGIPAELGEVELVVKPYVTINGVKVYGTTVTVVVNPVAE